jgi:serine/threonine protein phosphatase PrpC
LRVTSSARAAGNTHPGLLRETNEDRFLVDAERGVFVVIDGVGGQAAGEKAADTALVSIRERLERGTGRAEDRVRYAIAAANNDVYNLASRRPDWKGMACVLTVAVLDDGDAVVGHVGDTRLYKLHSGRIEKLTRDHSPVGEREDAGELSEQEAMRHPRRNEVYRDVGSELHRADDAGFIDVFRVPFEPDAALLLCTDGLTDSVASDAIAAIVEAHAGRAEAIALALIDAANEAGGKDNVTVVYVEGNRFVQGTDTRDLRRARRPAPAPRPTEGRVPAPPVRSMPPAPTQARPRSRWLTVALVAALVITLGLAAYAMRDRWIPALGTALGGAPPARTIVVHPGQSIAAAAAAARPGDDVIVEPGEYRERLVVPDGVRIRSRVSRGASIRLPGGASEADAAIVAMDVAGAELSGFRIVGDAATPLGTGVSLRNARLTMVDMEIAGARHAAVEFGAASGGALLASDLHDNPGLAVVVRAGASPRIAHSAFARNATAGRTAGPIVVEAGGQLELRGNVFHGVSPESLALPGPAGAIATENTFVGAPDRAPRPSRPGQRGQRGNR